MRYHLLFSAFTLVVALSQTAHAGRIVFDEGHGQRFLIGRDNQLDLSRLAGVFRGVGHTVAATAAHLESEVLEGADVLVISGPFQGYAPTEVEAIHAFVERGGSLCVMLHIAPPLAPLLHSFGVEHSNGVIRVPDGAIAGNPLDFRTTMLANHPLFHGVQQVTLYGAWALLDNSPDVHAIATTPPSAWIDLNADGKSGPGDARGAFAVAVAGYAAKGKLVVFGDDALFQNRNLVGGNLALARNLAGWLAPARGGAPEVPAEGK